MNSYARQLERLLSTDVGILLLVSTDGGILLLVRHCCGNYAACEHWCGNFAACKHWCPNFAACEALMWEFSILLHVRHFSSDVGILMHVWHLSTVWWSHLAACEALHHIRLVAIELIFVKYFSTKESPELLCKNFLNACEALLHCCNNLADFVTL